MDIVSKLAHAEEWSEVDHTKPIPAGVYIIRAADKAPEKPQAQVLRFPGPRK